MFHDEFDRIRERQQQYFPDISDEQWKKLRDAIFFQRPLKSQRHRIGKCEIDGGPRCCDVLDVFQQFRIWQTVQNLRLEDAYALGRPAELSLEEQQKLVDALQTVAMLSWSKVRKLLGFDKGTKFTIQEWNTKGLTGHRTNSEMIKVFGEDWLTRPVEDRDTISLEVLYFRNPSAMIRRGQQEWGLSKEQASLLPETRLEEAHARHSKQTLRRFVEGMSQGLAYSTIRKELTGRDDSAAVDRLPPLNQTGLDINNPAVIRALTEVRKVVNGLIREMEGVKPHFIRIEMARELKNSRDRRRKLHNDNEDRRKRRERAIENIRKEIPGLKFSKADIDKWLLAEECEWTCPYTGKTITPKTLLGSHPQFDVEHIYPRRFLDNSFSNKTLCHHEFNRDVKGDRTAYDACHQLDAWPEILQRVRRFQGPMAAIKLKRFQTGKDTIGDDFTSRHLNDTRYNAVVAKKYLESLYGGPVDESGMQRVFAVTGGHTAELRWQWHLNAVLSDTDQKSRDDHRHHAVDAIVIALTDAARVKTLQEAAEFAQAKHSHRFYEAVRDPWPRFIDDVAGAVEAINVSHRATRTLAGPLHAESIYSKQHTNADGSTEHRIRKAVTKLSATELKKDKIVDPAVRKAVLDKLQELGESNPAKAFAEESNHPTLRTKDGRQIPIHKVRVVADKKPRSIGKGARQRHVASGKDSNFASMIYAVLDDDGNEIKWEHKVLTRLEAHERLNRNRRLKGERVLIPDSDDFSDDKRRVFKFALVKNDMLLLEGPDGEDVLYRVQKLSQGEIQLCEHNKTTVLNDQRTLWNRIRSIDVLRDRHMRLAHVSPSGTVSIK
jgi:CRISPR-associated endonuclease Csn1